MILHMDFETRSDVDLFVEGLHNYARGVHTDLLMMAYAFDDGPVNLWLPHQDCPPDVYHHIANEGTVWAHNAPFEIEMTNQVAAIQYGFPYLYPDQCVCTMAMAYAMGLPGSLENCAAALGISERKDLEGSRLMKQMSKPREILEDGTIIWWDEPKKMRRLAQYCVQDIVVERMVGHRMVKLSSYEKQVWLIDQKINSRGMCVDVEAAKKAINLCEFEKERLNLEMRRITNNEVATCTATQQIKNYLNMFGVSAESIDKGSVIDLLKDPNIHPKVKEVLDLRSDSAKAAASKFEPMVLSAGTDNRIRGCFQYSAAGTRRWGGRRVQLHNLKRPTFKPSTIETIIKDVKGGMSAADVAVLYGPPLTILGDCTRAFLTAAPGHELICCDLNAIEARIVAWLAGEDGVLDAFRNGDDIYISQAMDIFGLKKEQIGKESYERLVGKVAILALGYGGGVGAFLTMAKGYNVQMAPAFDALWKRANDYQRELVERNFKQNGSKHEISREEFIASDLTKLFWRAANPAIVDYWNEVEQAVINAVNYAGVAVSAGPKERQVVFLKKGSFLWAKLPSNGVICYPYPEIKPTKTPWGEEKNLLTYMAVDGQSQKWQRYSTYGGSLVENLTQSLARDVLADAMLNLEKINYPVVLHVHDEIACELPLNKGSIDTMKEVMSKSPSWGKDLPLAASGWKGFRYRK